MNLVQILKSLWFPKKDACFCFKSDLFVLVSPHSNIQASTWSDLLVVSIKQQQYSVRFSGVIGGIYSIYIRYSDIWMSCRGVMDGALLNCLLYHYKEGVDSLGDLILSCQLQWGLFYRQGSRNGCWVVECCVRHPVLIALSLLEIDQSCGRRVRGFQIFTPLLRCCLPL